MLSRAQIAENDDSEHRMSCFTLHTIYFVVLCWAGLKATSEAALGLSPL